MFNLYNRANRYYFNEYGRNNIQPDMILVEKDYWISGEDGSAKGQLLDLRQNGHVLKLPRLILLATNISDDEFDKAKAAGFSDTVIMKPLRASMIAACLQQVLSVGMKKQAGKDAPNESKVPIKSLLCGKKILVVDDNMVNRRVAAGALKKFGANVECAESGATALKLLQIPHSFDACFMDIQMPEMDGYVSFSGMAISLFHIIFHFLLTLMKPCPKLFGVSET